MLRAETDTDETVEAEYQGIDVSKYPNLQEALNSCAINNHGFRIAFVDGFIDGDSSDSSVFIVLQSSDAADGDQLQEIGRFNRQGPVPVSYTHLDVYKRQFLHSSKRNKPALALDLMEEFRAPIADSVVQTVVNNGEIKRNGFANVMGSVRLRDETRKTLIGAYERRMATELKHPVYAYRASWRRIVEIQARMVLGRLEGSLERYRGIRVR